MPASGLTDVELRFLRELRERGVDFTIVGLSAALLQGATIATEGVDLWFERLDDPRIAEAAPVRILRLERILASKRAAGRPKDLAAIPALEAALAASDDDSTTE